MKQTLRRCMEALDPNTKGMLRHELSFPWDYLMPEATQVMCMRNQNNNMYTLLEKKRTLVVSNQFFTCSWVTQGCNTKSRDLRYLFFTKDSHTPSLPLLSLVSIFPVDGCPVTTVAIFRFNFPKMGVYPLPPPIFSGLKIGDFPGLCVASLNLNWVMSKFSKVWRNNTDTWALLWINYSPGHFDLNTI